MRHDRLLFVLVPLFLIVVGALVIKQLWLREEAKPVAMEDKAPVAKEDKAPVVERGLTPNCEKELRRTADLLRFFANRIQTGEEVQSVVAEKYRQFASSCSVTQWHIHPERPFQKFLRGFCD